MGKKNKYKQKEQKPVDPAPTQQQPQGSAQLEQGPATSSGSAGSSGRQQVQRSQGGQGWGGQKGGQQQPQQRRIPQQQQQQQRPQGVSGAVGPPPYQQQLGEQGLAQGPAPSSGSAGSSGRQQVQRSQGGQGWDGQQQQRGSTQPWSSQPQQRRIPQQQQQRPPPHQQQHGQQGLGQGPPAGAAPLPQPAGSIQRGTIGRPGQVAVNYLEIDMTEMPEQAYHYDVKIQPERPKKFYRQAFEQFRSDQLGGLEVSFDGSASCYSADKLPTNIQNPEVTVVDGLGRSLRFTVEIKETADPVINLNALKSSNSISDKSKQCLEVVLATPCHSKAIRAGGSFYQMSGKGERQELGDGFEAFVGLNQAIILGDRPYLNIDISHKSFPIAMPVLEYLQKYGLREGAIGPNTDLNKSRRFIELFLKGLTVVYTPPVSFASTPRRYKVNGLSKYPANSEKFEQDGRLITIADYFRDRNYRLKFPQLHCLHVGAPMKNIMLPIELCCIEGGQALNRKDGAAQVAKMIRITATPTHERKAKIMSLLESFKHNLDPTISRFGLRIGNDFIVVNTRTLSPPLVEYRGNMSSSVRNGSWNMNGKRFLEPNRKVHKWAILYLNAPHARKLEYNQVANFGEKVLAQGETVGVSLEHKADIRGFKDERSLDDCFADLKKGQCDLVFVIIPQFGASYDFIKQKAELKHGILTQCIKQLTIEKRLNPQTLANILLKINCKLNGINHKLADVTDLTMLNNVMYMGADVTHPSPDQRNIPSVVGVVASHDPYGAAYHKQHRLQRSTLELIEDMESITMELLRVYHEHRRAYPEHILYYRDGVDNGQFSKIRDYELGGIKAACNKLDIYPKICCIIVAKRHHTRFFPKQKPQFGKKFDYNNVEPGTVVDRTIVHPNEVQFFMVSHESIQGTARPTRYNIIENTGSLDINLLQQLTFNLCHLFPRCTRSVSYPAPTYLAHHAAARARVYLNDTHRSLDLKKEYEMLQIVPEFLKNNPMYFV